MYASTLPELAGQKFNDIAEATLAIDNALWAAWYKMLPANDKDNAIWYDMLPIKKRAHVCLEWIVAV
jgi:hypothetical protein